MTPGYGGLNSYNPYLDDTGTKSGEISFGVRGINGREVGGENSAWGINPASGREEAAFAGPGGNFYLASDLVNKYGGLEQASQLMNPDADAGGSGHTNSPYLFGINGWGSRPSNDFLSGKDGWADALKIAGMAAPVLGGWAMGAEGMMPNAAGTAAYEGGAGAGAFDMLGAEGAGTYEPDVYDGSQNYSYEPGGGGDYVGDLPMADDAFYGGDYGGLSQYAGDAEGMFPGEPSGQYGGPTGAGTPGLLDRASAWVKENPFLARAGLGAGVAGLQMLGARSAAKKSAAISGQQIEAQRARQALMDNPPAYSSMNIQRPGQKMDFSQTAVMNPQALRTYGQRPEQRFFNARGGLPAQASKLGGLEKYVGGDGGGQDDNVPAMLSPKEYVIDADVVAALGDGNPDHGARKLDAFRERVRSHKRAAPTGKIPPKARTIDSYMRKGA